MAFAPIESARRSLSERHQELLYLSSTHANSFCKCEADIQTCRATEGKVFATRESLRPYSEFFGEAIRNELLNSGRGGGNLSRP